MGVRHAAAVADSPAVVPDPFMEVMAPMLERYRDTEERRRSLALLRAVRLAPDLETCEMILAQGRAPRSRLDPEWAKAYGL